jgi:hypothetical protein
MTPLEELNRFKNPKVRSVLAGVPATNLKRFLSLNGDPTGSDSRPSKGSSRDSNQITFSHSEKTTNSYTTKGIWRATVDRMSTEADFDDRIWRRAERELRYIWVAFEHFVYQHTCWRLGSSRRPVWHIDLDKVQTWRIHSVSDISINLTFYLRETPQMLFPLGHG